MGRSFSSQHEEIYYHFVVKKLKPNFWVSTKNAILLIRSICFFILIEHKSEANSGGHCWLSDNSIDMTLTFIDMM